jgi:hypothetical protein
LRVGSVFRAETEAMVNRFGIAAAALDAIVRIGG